LASGTVIAIFFAVGVAVLYVRWIYKPVGLLAGKMEEIEKSGAFGRLVGKFASGEDEFGRLGGTFNRMMSRLEDNYLRQRHFVQDASHELRTPLTVIASYAGMLRRWGGDDRKLREEAVTAIEQESERLLHLVKNLLQSADEDEETPKAAFAVLDLLELAVQTAHELFLSFERTITVQPLPGQAALAPSPDKDSAAAGAAADFRLEGDREKLKQLLIILLDNALKYSSEPVDLLLRAEPDKDRIILSVKDRGVGIAPEHISRLFDRFYRVDEARTRRTGGSGLGLSIARRIVAEHRGEIAVESEPGQGTVVTVRLPRQHEDSAEKDF
jgi:two-component system, OmpR family, sensor histidine kinase ArlS